MTIKNHCKEIHHIRMRVSSAGHCAMFLCTAFGFRPLAYRGLETGSRQICSHVVKCNEAVFIFESDIRPAKPIPGLQIVESQQMIPKVDEYPAGEQSVDMVKDVAFVVDNIDRALSIAKTGGAKILMDKNELRDKNGVVYTAMISAFGNITHTLIENHDYQGPFLPGYSEPLIEMPFLGELPPVDLQYFDHFVDIVEPLGLERTVTFYEKCLGLKRFYVPEEIGIETENSRLEIFAMANDNRRIIVNICQPQSEEKFSQLTEFLLYNRGQGIQHIALNTNNIIQDVRHLRQRGVQFLEISPSYYKNLREKIHSNGTKIPINIDAIEELGILLDFDDKGGYLMQLFTRPLFDRPTSYIELIQRSNHSGFGRGNVLALYEAVELEQRRRGNLV